MQAQSKAIPLIVNNDIGLPQPISFTGSNIHDSLQRPLRDLRISVTDRCNFRCTYCMPKELFDKNYRFFPHKALLSFEEIVLLAKAFITLGVKKLRITGGEPLLRKDIEKLITMLSELRTPEGEALDLTMTTNASLLVRKAKALKAAGLKRITISLDALSDATFRAINDVDFPVQQVLDAIDFAQQTGFANIKVNMVVKRGTNDHEILPMLRYFRHRNITLRFIEFMDVGNSNHWDLSAVLPSAQVLDLIRSEFSIQKLAANSVGETAERWALTDGSAEFGLISSVTHAFCGECNRARLSTEGRLFLCLFAEQGYDLRPLLQTGDTSSATQLIAAHIAAIWQQRNDRYSLMRMQQQQTAPKQSKKIEMSYIGG